MWILIGAGMVIGGIALSVVSHVAAGVAVLVLGALVLINQKGQRRIRATNSKLLVENERLIRGFLIGPRKDRIPWEDVQGLSVEGGALVVRTPSGPQRVGEGASDEELTVLKEKIETALERRLRGR